jgi:predicted small secreted protein
MRRPLVLAALLLAAFALAACGGGETISQADGEGVAEAPEILAEHPVTSPAAMAAGIVDDDGTHESNDGEAEDAAPAAATPPAGAG